MCTHAPKKHQNNSQQGFKPISSTKLSGFTYQLYITLPTRPSNAVPYHKTSQIKITMFWYNYLSLCKDSLYFNLFYLTKLPETRSDPMGSTYQISLLLKPYSIMASNLINFYFHFWVSCMNGKPPNKQHNQSKILIIFNSLWTIVTLSFSIHCGPCLTLFSIRCEPCLTLFSIHCGPCHTIFNSLWTMSHYIFNSLWTIVTLYIQFTVDHCHTIFNSLWTMSHYIQFTVDHCHTIKFIIPHNRGFMSRSYIGIPLHKSPRKVNLSKTHHPDVPTTSRMCPRHC